MNAYRLDVYDTSGDKLAELTDFWELTYNRTVNGAGLVYFELPEDHRILTHLADQWQFEVWRKPKGKSWGREITGVYRKLEDDRKQIFRTKLTCPGLLTMLGWRSVMWAAGTANRSVFTSAAAETIAKTLVSYNAGADATVANGRLCVGTLSGLSVAADAGGGNTLDWYCAFSNLLKTLQNLSLVGGGDFDLVKTSPTTYEFRWYPGQLGDDKTGDVTFSMAKGNMANPVYIDDRMDVKTIAVVGGSGTGAARNFEVQTSSEYDADDNHMEIFVDARNVTTAAGLTARGDQELEKHAIQPGLTFDVLQTKQSLYGVHYDLGDLVKVIDPKTGTSYQMKIESVAVSIGKGGEEKIQPIIGKQNVLHAEDMEVIQKINELSKAVEFLQVQE
jgi:hypothetical protein